MHKKIIIDPRDCDISNDLDTINTSYIYGEAYPPDVVDCIRTIIPNLGKYSSFIDIGSGLGKLVYEISLSYPKMICHGIEIHKSRYEKSLNKLPHDKTSSKIHFEKICFTNIYFGKYDIIYCCNTTFSEEDNKILYSKIRNEGNGYVILYNYDNTLNHNIIGTYTINTSWDKNVKIYIFYV